MKNAIIKQIEDLHFRTSLLESMDWDDDLFDVFMVFFNEELAKDTDPSVLFDLIFENFGENTYSIIVDLFKETAEEIDNTETEH